MIFSLFSLFFSLSLFSRLSVFLYAGPPLTQLKEASPPGLFHWQSYYFSRGDYWRGSSFDPNQLSDLPSDLTIIVWIKSWLSIVPPCSWRSQFQLNSIVVKDRYSWALVSSGTSKEPKRCVTKSCTTNRR